MQTQLRFDLIAAAIFACVVFVLLPAFLGFDGFELNTLSRYLTLGIAALALSLSWGVGGLLNLGQAGTFGLGAYIMAMHLKMKASAGIPDFMTWNNLDALPWFWAPFNSLGVTLVAGLAVPAAIGALLGSFMFRARISGVFVAVITLAVLVALQLLVIEHQAYTGGQNGISGLAHLQLFGWSVDPYSISFYYFIAAGLTLAVAIGLYVSHSKFGLILRATMEDADRVRFFGYNVALYQTAAFAISAALSGFAGMLYVLSLEFASPTYFGVSFSLAIVIWCAVGGRESVIAAAIGAIIVNALQGQLSDIFVEGWNLILGTSFVLLVIFAPRGLYGIALGLTSRLRKGLTPDQTPEPKTLTASGRKQEERG